MGPCPPHRIKLFGGNRNDQEPRSLPFPFPFQPPFQGGGNPYRSICTAGRKRRKCMSMFESYFTNDYPFQESMMKRLNRLDFKNLQLAGLRTPVSQELQKLHLIPSKCNEVLITVTPGSIPVMITPCPNTTQVLDFIQACHGRHRDGADLQGHEERRIEPQCLFKHVRGSHSFMQTPNENDGGHFDFFNVCIDCYDRDRGNKRIHLGLTLGTFKSRLCILHCLEHASQRPYNTCHCKESLEKYWRCFACWYDTLEGIPKLEGGGNAWDLFGIVVSKDFCRREKKKIKEY